MISEGTSRASRPYLVALHHIIKPCSMFTRGSYCSFAGVQDRLVPSKTQFRPQNLAPRFDVSASWGPQSLHFSSDGSTLHGCGEQPETLECVWARKVSADHPAPGSDDERVPTGELKVCATARTGVSYPAMGDPVHMCLSDPAQGPQLVAVCVRFPELSMCEFDHVAVYDVADATRVALLKLPSWPESACFTPDATLLLVKHKEPKKRWAYRISCQGSGAGRWT